MLLGLGGVAVREFAHAQFEENLLLGGEHLGAGVGDAVDGLEGRRVVFLVIIGHGEVFFHFGGAGRLPELLHILLEQRYGGGEGDRSPARRGRDVVVEGGLGDGGVEVHVVGLLERDGGKVGLPALHGALAEVEVRALRQVVVLAGYAAEQFLGGVVVAVVIFYGAQQVERRRVGGDVGRLGIAFEEGACHFRLAGLVITFAHYPLHLGEQFGYGHLLHQGAAVAYNLFVLAAAELYLRHVVAGFESRGFILETATHVAAARRCAFRVNSLAGVVHLPRFLELPVGVVEVAVQIVEVTEVESCGGLVTVAFLKSPQGLLGLVVEPAFYHRNGLAVGVFRGIAGREGFDVGLLVGEQRRAELVVEEVVVRQQQAGVLHVV